MIPRWALLRELLRRDLDVRWRGSVLGGFWSLLQPLAWMAIYLVVFNSILRVPPPRGAERFGFGIFLLSGLLPFLAFQEGVVRGASAWGENANILKKMQVEPTTFVITACLSALVLEGAALSLLTAWELATGTLDQPWRLFWIFPGLLAQFLLTLLPALAAAILAAFIRDLLLALPFVLTVAFYLTPVVYPRELAPPSIGPILDLNPMAWVLQFFRAAFAGGPPPSMLSIGVGLPLLIVAVWLASRLADHLRPHLVDVL